MADESTGEATGSADPKPPKSAPRKKSGKIRIPRPPAKPEREQSSIQFPYQDLEAAISVARALLAGGGVALSRDQLAGVMNLAAGSGNFVLKVATARLFGLVAFSGGKYELTDLGFNILDSDERRQKEARAKAFLNVPLYKRTYDEFRSRQLPPRPHGLEQAFVRFGVARKQRTNARLAFDKSAAQAGFFQGGADRLIEPIIGPGAAVDRGRPPLFAEEEPSFSEPAPVERSGPDTSGLHPFIQGLLSTLPQPHTGWRVEGRAKWLQAAANIFDLLYTGSGEIKISARSDTPDIAQSDTPDIPERAE